MAILIQIVLVAVKLETLDEPKAIGVLVFFVCWAFRKTDVHFTPNKAEYRMPLLMSFILIGFFIWLAENIATFYGAWKYPNQVSVWSQVHIGKWSSWSLVIMTFIIVTNLKLIKTSIQYNKLQMLRAPSEDKPELPENFRS